MNTVTNRLKVIELYKKLLKTRNTIFENDNAQLAATITRLRNTFRENKNETDSQKIKELIKLGTDVNRLLRTSVYQTVKVSDTRFQLKIKPHMLVDDKIN